MKNRLNVVLCWHMHQPWYRETLDGPYRLPWVYLHAMKDYTDMAAHLEGNPRMRAVVNFAPVLLDQIDDYDQQLRGWLSDGTPFDDPLLNLLSGAKPIPDDLAARAKLVDDCTRAHAPRMIDPYPAYAQLLAWARPDGKIDEALLDFLNEQFFLDLLTWYHLAWLGHSLKQHETAKRLIAKARNFDIEDRHALLQLMADAFATLIGRYRKLHERGQIELSMSPYGHPIVPLLIDFDAMHCAMPDAPSPSADGYPDGERRARWHIEHGLRVFEDHFGIRPVGMWLSEGGISEEAVALIEEYDFRWTASGEGVWHNSCYLSNFGEGQLHSRRTLFKSHHLPEQRCRLFFRDDGLSDLIGFEYHHWDAEQAAADFVGNLENIADFLADQPAEHVVSVILDGENAWEHYADNGQPFLEALYHALTRSERLRLTTFAEASMSTTALELPHLCAGSWVYGSFSTWIGSPDKNRAWDRLVEAKQAYDRHITELSGERRAAAERQLAICEGSDWFWWFGDYNPSDSVRDFDELYRQQLKNLYRLLGQPLPRNLDEPLSHGGGQAEGGGTMRRGHGQ